MEDLITLLKEVDNEYYKGGHTLGERCDLIKEIYEILTKQKFI